MFTLFRRIRQKLIESGSTTKYLLYAIGEILLVVIGILIALSVNNWNEERIERNQEEKIIARLNAEFINNLEILQNELARLDSTHHAVEQLLDLELGPDRYEYSDEEWNRLILKSVQTPTWNPSSYVLTDLKNSGRISSLNDEQLVKDLFSWEKQYDNAVENTENFKRNLNSYLEYMVDSGLIRSANADFGVKSNPLDTEFRNDIINDMKFYNILHERLLLATVVINEYNAARDRLNELIEVTR